MHACYKLPRVLQFSAFLNINGLSSQWFEVILYGFSTVWGEWYNIVHVFRYV